jgi:threonine dehydratase
VTGKITRAAIYRARQAIAPWVRRTPLVRSEALSARMGCNVHLKLETLQETGAFKLRGAVNRLLQLSEAERAQGVVAVSTGNHARAVAHAAWALGVPATVCMSSLVPDNKVAAVRATGAEVRIVGRTQDEAEEVGKQLAAEQGLVFVSPFDDPWVIAGQGTIGLELLEDLPALDAVLVPLSGGGLIGGIALALKSAARTVRVIGISMERGPAMVRSLAAGRPVPVEEEPSLADSLGGGIGLLNRYTFALARELLDETILVSEDEIAAAMAHCYWQEQQIVEGAAAVGIAALLAGKLRAPGANLAVVLSGRNVDMRRFSEIVAGAAPEAGDRPCPSPS